MNSARRTGPVALAGSSFQQSSTACDVAGAASATPATNTAKDLIAREAIVSLLFYTVLHNESVHRSNLSEQPASVPQQCVAYCARRRPVKIKKPFARTLFGVGM